MLIVVEGIMSGDVGHILTISPYHQSEQHNPKLPDNTFTVEYWSIKHKHVYIVFLHQCVI